MLLISYNIHKGVMGFRNRKLTIHALRERLQKFEPDIVFLQEVQGQHQRHARYFDDWPSAPQHEFLAQQHVAGQSQPKILYHSAYGLNAFYRHGHHGNALLSRYPIDWRLNHDVSDHRLEKRGMLHCQVDTPAGAVHTLVVHFGLLASSRRRQMEQLISHVLHAVPVSMPLLIAGDFNDWEGRLTRPLEKALGVQEVFSGFLSQAYAGAASFPSNRPVLRLDRVYQRGFFVKSAQVLSGPDWAGLSDHAPLLIDLDVLIEKP